MRPAAVVAVFTAQLACLGPPTRVQESPRNFISTSHPDLVWATLADGRDVVIERPTIIRDTLFGTIAGETVIMPSDSVAEVRVRTINKTRTALIPAGIGVGLLAVILFVERDPNAPTPVDSTDLYECRTLPDPANCQ